MKSCHYDFIVKFVLLPWHWQPVLHLRPFLIIQDHYEPVESLALVSFKSVLCRCWCLFSDFVRGLDGVVYMLLTGNVLTDFKPLGHLCVHKAR